MPLSTQSDKLVVSHIGYRSDTLFITNQRNVRILLREEAKAAQDVSVVGERSSTSMDYLNTHSVQILTSKELFKAACCNLSESFQTNASIDVSFTNAITGTKQIKMTRAFRHLYANDNATLLSACLPPLRMFICGHAEFCAPGLPRYR